MGKKRKPPRKGKGGRAKASPPSPFARARVAPISRPFARVSRASIPPAPMSAAAATESRRSQVRKLLLRRGVYPEVVEKIVAMEPGTYYMLDIYGFASSDPNDDGMPGDEPVKQASYVGSGAHLWVRVIGYANKAPIEHVEIVELDGAVVGRPLWGTDSVKTVDGVRFYGHGGLEEWRDRKKVGRPKKSGGGMNATARRKNDKSKSEAKKRRDATRARYDKLKKTDPIGAERLMMRSKNARKVDL